MSIMDSTGEGNRMAPSLCTRCKVCLWWCGRACHWIPVLVILGIVTWSYYAYVVELCLRTLDNVVQQCTYLVIYHFLIIMFMWSYWRTICTTAKQIPSKYKLPPAEIQKLLSAESEDAQRAILEEFAKDLPVFTRTNSGAIRYCNRCVLVKPDRAHHCSICGKCVLKMDHHCPWVNNCVCYQNYKFFILFLGYAILYCIYIAATTLPSFIVFWKMLGSSPIADKVVGDLQTQSNSRYHIVFVFFVALIFLISLMSLFVYHCYLVVKNRTTLGSLIGRHYSPKKKVKSAPKNIIFANKLPPVVFKANGLTEAFRAPMFRSGSDRNGFNLGAYKNFKEVFGDDPKLWLIPVFSSLGDGTVFPVREEHQLHTITLNQEPHGYESMGTTKSSFGDGQAFPLPQQDEDTESLLSCDRWDRWGERARPFDERDGSSLDEL